MIGNEVVFDEKDPGTGIRRLAYKVHEQGEVDGQSYDFEYVLLLVEVPMVNERKWGQTSMLSVSAWEDLPVREMAWNQLIELAHEGITRKLGD